MLESGGGTGSGMKPDPSKNDIPTPKSEIETRIIKLQAHLCGQNIGAAMILQNTDLFYFTGTIQRCYLYIPAEGSPLLMARKNIDRARSESPIDRILPVEGPTQIPEILRGNGYPLPGRLGLECDVIPANLYFSYQNIFRGIPIEDISQAIRRIRSVKTPFEIDMIRQASRLADRVAGAVADHVRKGISEIELAGRIESVARTLGHQGLVRMRRWGGEMFYGHIMAGPSAAIPSYMASPTGGPGVSRAVAQGPGFHTIQDQEPILVDYVFASNGYLADHTRIFALKGLPEKLLVGHQAMLDLQEVLIQAAKPGGRTGALYETAKTFAENLGYGDVFMGHGGQRVRFVGHGIGLELDEHPVLAENQEMPLQKGMVIALEPKLVFPDLGVVGIENTHVVTDEGLHRLTEFPDEIVIL